MNKKYAFLSIFLCGAAIAAAAAPMAEDHRFSENDTVTALKSLRRLRPGLLAAPLESVTFDKKVTAESGDKRDYFSFGIYWWPNPDTPDGLPYIQRDGVANPVALKSDSGKISRLRSNLATLAILAFYDNDQEAGRKGAAMLECFFTSETTGMNPHLTYAQAIPGRVKGRPIGIIDTYALVDVVQSAELLAKSGSLSPTLICALKKWFRNYRDWLLSKDTFADLAASPANIGLAYHTQLIAFSLYVGDRKLALDQTAVLAKRIAEAVAADGSMPHEMRRTKSWSYTVYALNIIMTAVTVCEEHQIMLIRDRNAGAPILRAIDFAAGFIDKSARWPGKQLDGAINVDLLGSILLKSAIYTGDPKYAALLRKLSKKAVSNHNIIIHGKRPPVKPEAK